ncbi:rap guanine nucleotide exchange factor 2-like isoform X4 [Leptotrombidium deliense]|uniref:Rap guanine nucleotide exchange factor 2-like isoform X4 n=1 Tax=Leptotrombidium deliense TaxID=299467 RepID=A0A443SSZ9_9ACAR|nr:rap guanine nucleotide exchange factor 2-like isoform X4 [Leptotrombidium deliense]
MNKTTDCITLEATDMLLLDYSCENDETNECPMNSTPNPAAAHHQRASSMYSCHSDTTTITTNTTTSSDSEIDLTGLVEGLVDDCDLVAVSTERSEKETTEAEEDCYISFNQIPSPSNQLVVLRQVLEKDPIERNESETEVILNFINNIPAFSKYDVNIRKQLASVMVLAIIEKPQTIILTHLEILDSFCCLIYGKVEHLLNNKTSKQLHPGDVFGITEPTMDTIYFDGIMKTSSPFCWFLCVSQINTYFKKQSEFCRHEEDGHLVLITEHRNIDNFRKGHVIIRGTASRLLLGLLECDSADPFYIDDYLLTYRVFMPSTATTGNNSSISLLAGMDTICAKLLFWFDEQHLRDKVIRIVLTWINSYYLDFDNHNLPKNSCMIGQNFLQLFETKLCSSLNLSTQLRLFHVALSTKAKIRQITITRSNRDEETLNFSILGGYEKGFGIFVAKVDEGSKAESLGLKRGDQILEVNGTNFAIISHARALEVLRSTTHLALTVKYNPFIFKEMISLPEGSKSKKPLTSALNAAALTLNSSPSAVTKPPNGGTKIKKAIPKFANFITRHFNNYNNSEDEVDASYSRQPPKNFSSSRSHSNPDLHSLTTSNSAVNNSPFYELMAGHHHLFSPNPQHVVRVFNAANGDSRYLLVHAETTAREIVMVSVREFCLCSQSSSGVKSSLNYALYEVSVVPEAATIKQRRLPDQLSNLAERASLHSRYYVKENNSSTTSSSSSNTSTNQNQSQHLGDDIAAEILRDCPQTLSFLNLNATQIAIELTLQDFNIFRSIEPQEFVYDLFADELRREEKELNLWRKELQEFESLSNKEMFWVINEILSEPSLVKRVKIIKCYIKIGNFCRTLHNYNSLFAILSGLGHGSVQRLKQTWDKLGAKYQKILKALQKIMDPSRNMALYRGEINTRSPPIIPFFPIVKKDLTFIHLAHLTVNCEDSLINFEKMRMIGKEIRNIINMSSQPYTACCNSTTSSSSFTGGSVPLPPPPPTTTIGASATTPKRMYEEAVMRKKVLHYLQTVFATINYDEDALLAKSLELEPGSAPAAPPVPPTTQNNISQMRLHNAMRMNNTQPSPTLSSTSSGSSGRLKFGAESPQQMRKLLSLRAAPPVPMRPPLPNYDEAIQRQHKLMNLVSNTKPMAVNRNPPVIRPQNTLTRNDDDKVSAV